MYYNKVLFCNARLYICVFFSRCGVMWMCVVDVFFMYQLSQFISYEYKLYTKIVGLRET
jgi:hypothetical protein